MAPLKTLVVCIGLVGCSSGPSVSTLLAGCHNQGFDTVGVARCEMSVLGSLNTGPQQPSAFSRMFVHTLAPDGRLLDANGNMVGYQRHDPFGGYTATCGTTSGGSAGNPTINIRCW
jgi:hypothetical protein